MEQSDAGAEPCLSWRGAALAPLHRRIGLCSRYLVQLPGLSLGGAKYPAAELRDAAGGTLAAWQGEHLAGLGLEME